MYVIKYSPSKRITSCWFKYRFKCPWTFGTAAIATSPQKNSNRFMFDIFWCCFCCSSVFWFDWFVFLLLLGDVVAFRRFWLITRHKHTHTKYVQTDNQYWGKRSGRCFPSLSCFLVDWMPTVFWLLWLTISISHLSLFFNKSVHWIHYFCFPGRFYSSHWSPLNQMHFTSVGSD